MREVDDALGRLEGTGHLRSPTLLVLFPYLQAPAYESWNFGVFHEGYRQAAEAAGARWVSYNSDMSAFAPDAYLTAPVWNWGPRYVEIIEAAQAGTYTPGYYWGSMADGVVDKRVLITAGGAGIGRAIAGAFSAAGARVHICDRDAEALRSLNTIRRVRAMQPGIVVNNRWGKVGDYVTPECQFPEEQPETWWETCYASGVHWGYNENPHLLDASWLARMRKRCTSWGGNFLVDVGPAPDGSMSDKFYDVCDELEYRT